jgi:hypothetical protein
LQRHSRMKPAKHVQEESFSVCVLLAAAIRLLWRSNGDEATFCGLSVPLAMQNHETTRRKPVLGPNTSIIKAKEHVYIIRSISSWLLCI